MSLYIFWESSELKKKKERKKKKSSVQETQITTFIKNLHFTGLLGGVYYFFRQNLQGVDSCSKGAHLDLGRGSRSTDTHPGDLMSSQGLGPIQNNRKLFFNSGTNLHFRPWSVVFLIHHNLGIWGGSHFKGSALLTLRIVNRVQSKDPVWRLLQLPRTSVQRHTRYLGKWPPQPPCGSMASWTLTWFPFITWPLWVATRSNQDHNDTLHLQVSVSTYQLLV